MSTWDEHGPGPWESVIQPTTKRRRSKADLERLAQELNHEVRWGSPQRGHGRTAM